MRLVTAWAVNEMTGALQRLRRVFSAWDRLVPLGLSLKILPTVIFPPDTRLIGVAGFRSEGFVHGIEILNDDRTTMEFVVWTLQELVGLEQATALERMLDIHTEGGVLLRMESEAEAERVAALVVSNARERNYPLICRAVNAQQDSAADVQGVHRLATNVYRRPVGGSRLFEAVWQGLAIALIVLFVLGIGSILKWITGRSFIPDAVAPVFLSLAVARAVRGVAAEYSPYSGRLWGFALSVGSALLFFVLVVLWASVATAP